MQKHSTGAPWLPAVEDIPGMSAETPIDELGIVRTLVPVETDEGEAVAAGIEGTVVAICASGAAFEIEFAEPIADLATVRHEHVARV